MNEEAKHHVLQHLLGWIFPLCTHSNDSSNKYIIIMIINVYLYSTTMYKVLFVVEPGLKHGRMSHEANKTKFS